MSIQPELAKGFYFPDCPVEGTPEAALIHAVNRAAENSMLRLLTPGLGTMFGPSLMLTKWVLLGCYGEEIQAWIDEVNQNLQSNTSTALPEQRQFLIDQVSNVTLALFLRSLRISDLAFATIPFLGSCCIYRRKKEIFERLKRELHTHLPLFEKYEELPIPLLQNPYRA